MYRTRHQKQQKQSIFIIQLKKIFPEGLGVDELFKFHTCRMTWSTVIHGVD